MSFKVTHFGITEKPTRDCVLLCNNVDFRVGNFEGKVWASKISRTPVIQYPLSREPLQIFAQTLYF